MKSTGSVITLVMLLQITVLSQCQNLNSFLEKHVVSENADITVTDIIRNRNIRSGNNCKKKNTFIHDTNGLRVKELCSKLAEKKDVKSEFCLPLTHGILQNNSAKPPDCIYVQKVIFGKIHITCENKEPVHLIGFEECLEKHERFKEKHIVQNDEKLDCNVAMQKQNFEEGKNENECTKKHTFIHDTNGKKCTQLCANSIDSPVVVSDIDFLLTHCILKKSSANAEECNYEQITESDKIQIICENSYPVYYANYQALSKPSSVYTYGFLIAILLISIFMLMNQRVRQNREAEQRDTCVCR